jgi:hypothetical protein
MMLMFTKANAINVPMLTNSTNTDMGISEPTRATKKPVIAVALYGVR